MNMRTPTAEAVTLLRLAWPVIVGQIGMMLMGTVDTLMVGQLDPASLAGVALGNVGSFATLILGIGTAVGVDPLVAQAWGARDEAGYDRALARASVLLLWLSVPITAAHLVVAPVFHALGQPPEVLGTAQAYALNVAPSVIPAIGFTLLRQALQARGRMQAAMWVVLGANVVNVGANLLFIYGWGPVPAFGAPGTGLATSLVRWAMFLVLVVLATREMDGIRRGWSDAWTLAAVGSVARLALPVGVQVGTEVWAFNLGTLIVGWSGADAVAAHTVAMNLSGLAFMVPMGLGAAVAARVGNLVGAGEAWTTAAWTAVGMACAYGVCTAALFIAAPELLTGLYLRDAGAAAVLAAVLLPYAGLFQVFDAAQAVLFGVLRGAGDTRLPSAANLVGYYVVGLPTAVWLSAGWGPEGVWVGYVVGLVVVAGLLVGRLLVIVRQGGVRVGV